jgi:hypothetical protein
LISTHQLPIPTSLLDAQIAEAAQQAGRAIESAPQLQAASAPRRPFASARGLMVTWTLCFGLTLLNLEGGGLLTTRAEDPEPMRLVAGLETSAAIDGRLVEAYLARHGVLPLSLAEVGLPDLDPNLRYERLDPRGYRVIVRHGDYEGTFDSRREAERRAALTAARDEAARELAAQQETWATEAEEWLLNPESHTRPGVASPLDSRDGYQTDGDYFAYEDPMIDDKEFSR